MEEDLRRRDFTINAMALQLENGEIIRLLDPTGGRADLEHALVRVLHRGSFLDDPTRMLRAIRYARRYGFDIAPGTLRLFNDEARKVLSTLSGERLRHELDLILDESNAAAMLADADMLKLLPAVDARLPRFEAVFAALLDVPPNAGQEIDRRTLGYLLWLMDLPEEELLVLRERLAFTAELGKALLSASSILDDLSILQDARPSIWTQRLDGVPPAAIHALYVRTREPAFARYLETWRNIHAHTTGEDLIARGLTPGPRFKEILSRLRAAWLDAEISSPEGERALLETILKGQVEP
jgi:tRNA nucleotidyltransferase (CCA-adding enzyme)